MNLYQRALDYFGLLKSADKIKRFEVICVDDNNGVIEVKIQFNPPPQLIKVDFVLED